jgi:hypothetical protein
MLTRLEQGGSAASGGPVVAAGSVLLAGSDEGLREHLEWVEAHQGCAGTSDHAALFREKDPDGGQLERAGARHRDAASVAGGGFFGSGATAAGGAQRGRVGGGAGRMGGGGGGRGRGSGGESGWQGAGDLSDMLSGLGISGDSAPTAGASGSSSGGPWGAPGVEAEAFAQRQRVAALQRKAQELADSAAAAAATAADLGRSLPDGGAKVRGLGGCDLACSGRSLNPLLPVSIDTLSD